MKIFILKIGWCGLGDHLFCSHLPRIAKQFGGYDKVYITNHSDFSRDLQIKKFVWEMNPYVDGFCDEDRKWPGVGSVEKGINLLDKIMLVHGLNDGKIFHEPEIYYKPKNILELSDAIIFDPNFGTERGHPSSLMIKNYFEQNNIDITYQMELRDNYHSIEGKKKLCSRNLEHFCDIISSCQDLYCFNTGTAPLAAALGKSTTVFHNGGGQKRFLHSQLHSYILLKEAI